MRLTKDVFLALTAVAWADGDVTTAEARAIVRAASASGLGDAELEEIERATQDRLALEELPPGSLTVDSCKVIYGLACYLAAADGTIVDAERAAIARMGDRLALSPEDRKRALSDSVALAQSMNAGMQTIESLQREVRRSAKG